MNNMRGRVMPGSLGGEPPSPTKFGAVNPPRAAFVNMPTYPSSASSKTPAELRDRDVLHVVTAD